MDVREIEIKMEPFKNSTIVTPFDKVNVDTDQIIPKQFLKLFKNQVLENFYFIIGDMMKTKNPNLILF